mgnify:FL=1|jgi:hypothetical protein
MLEKLLISARKVHYLLRILICNLEFFFEVSLKKLITTFLILPVLCLILFACGGSAIGDAQEFSPNEAPSIVSIKAVNFDGSEITQLDIEPYKQFKLIVEASDIGCWFLLLR